MPNLQMLKSKGDRLSKTVIFKDVPNEDNEMVDIDLHEVITSSQSCSDNENLINIKKQTKRLLKIILASAIGFTILTCILLTLIIVVYDSKTTRLSTESNFNVQEISISDKLHQQELMKRDFEDNVLLGVSQYHYLSKRGISKESDSKIQEGNYFGNYEEASPEDGSAENAYQTDYNEEYENNLSFASETGESEELSVEVTTSDHENHSQFKDLVKFVQKYASAENNASSEAPLSSFPTEILESTEYNSFSTNSPEAFEVSTLEQEYSSQSDAFEDHGQGHEPLENYTPKENQVEAFYSILGEEDSTISDFSFTITPETVENFESSSEELSTIPEGITASTTTRSMHSSQDNSDTSIDFEYSTFTAPYTVTNEDSTSIIKTESTNNEPENNYQEFTSTTSTPINDHGIEVKQENSEVEDISEESEVYLDYRNFGSTEADLDINQTEVVTTKSTAYDNLDIKESDNLQEILTTTEEVNEFNDNNNEYKHPFSSISSNEESFETEIMDLSERYTTAQSENSIEQTIDRNNSSSSDKKVFSSNENYGDEESKTASISSTLELSSSTDTEFSSSTDENSLFTTRLTNGNLYFPVSITSSSEITAESVEDSNTVNVQDPNTETNGIPEKCSTTDLSNPTHIYNDEYSTLAEDDVITSTDQHGTSKSADVINFEIFTEDILPRDGLESSNLLLGNSYDNENYKEYTLPSTPTELQGLQLPSTTQNVAEDSTLIVMTETTDAEYDFSRGNNNAVPEDYIYTTSENLNTVFEETESNEVPFTEILNKTSIEIEDNSGSLNVNDTTSGSTTTSELDHSSGAETTQTATSNYDIWYDSSTIHTSDEFLERNSDSLKLGDYVDYPNFEPRTESENYALGSSSYDFMNDKEEQTTESIFFTVSDSFGTELFQDTTDYNFTEIITNEKTTSTVLEFADTTEINFATSNSDLEPYISAKDESDEGILVTENASETSPEISTQYQSRWNEETKYFSEETKVQHEHTTEVNDDFNTFEDNYPKSATFSDSTTTEEYFTTLESTLSPHEFTESSTATNTYSYNENYDGTTETLSTNNVLTETTSTIATTLDLNTSTQLIYENKETEEFDLITTENVPDIAENYTENVYEENPKTSDRSLMDNFNDFDDLEDYNNVHLNSKETNGETDYFQNTVESTSVQDNLHATTSTETSPSSLLYDTWYDSSSENPEEYLIMQLHDSLVLDESSKNADTEADYFQDTAAELNTTENNTYKNESSLQTTPTENIDSTLSYDAASYSSTENFNEALELGDSSKETNSDTDYFQNVAESNSVEDNLSKNNSSVGILGILHSTLPYDTWYDSSLENSNDEFIKQHGDSLVLLEVHTETNHFHDAAESNSTDENLHDNESSFETVTARFHSTLSYDTWRDFSSENSQEEFIDEHGHSIVTDEISDTSTYTENISTIQDEDEISSTAYYREFENKNESDQLKEIANKEYGDDINATTKVSDYLMENTENPHKIDNSYQNLEDFGTTAVATSTVNEDNHFTTISPNKVWYSDQNATENKEEFISKNSDSLVNQNYRELDKIDYGSVNDGDSSLPSLTLHKNIFDANNSDCSIETSSNYIDSTTEDLLENTTDILTVNAKSDVNATTENYIIIYESETLTDFNSYAATSEHTVETDFDPPEIINYDFSSINDSFSNLNSTSSELVDNDEINYDSWLNDEEHIEESIAYPTTEIHLRAYRNAYSNDGVNNSNLASLSKNAVQQNREVNSSRSENASLETDESHSSARWSNQNGNGFVNVKTDPKEFPTVSEHVQGSQQTPTNQNFGTLCPTFTSPMGIPILQQASTFPYLYNPNQYGFPLTVQRSQFNPYMPQQYSTANLSPLYSKILQPQSGYVLYNSNTQNTPASTSPGGQYYMCYPLTSSFSNTYGTPEVEIRRSMGDVNLQRSFFVHNSQNKTRASRDCPLGEHSCEDGSKCIKNHQVCDGDVQCKDASDEMFCSCRLRISASRLCDGYFDCPNGEDEINCFGCEESMFSCDDWSPRQRSSTCIPMDQRCDGITHCLTGKDEQDCTLLKEIASEKQNLLVSSTTGFLYRNHKGRWYPACRNPEIWANELCRIEAGPSTIAPLTHLVPIKIEYDGSYATAVSEGVKIVDTCEDGAAVYVECPPLVCGLRVKLRNPYRMEEVDTSAEQVLMQLENSNESKHETEDKILGESRIVGGKPSQPEAWPWVVSVYRNGVFHCGGALVNEFWVVTAAHCVDRYWHYYFEIQVGVLRRYSFSPMMQNRMVSHIISHQLYDRAKLKNDLALMRLSKPVRFNRYVRPICLPSEITAGKNYLWGPEPKTICTVVGWGATIEHGSDPDHLREVEVYVFKRCKHREDEEGREICAGLVEGGKDACQGDSGGPFMCRNPNVPNQWYLAGIVSHGEGCARPNEPGVYTRVSLFLDWILENIRAEVLPQTRPLRRCPGYVCRATNRCISSKRRCDKIIDCLLGDDEQKCDRNSINEIFKHAMRRVFLLGSPHDGGSENSTEVSLDSGAVTREPATTAEISNLTTTPSPGTNFVCKSILEIIDLSKKCNRVADCEDATDEKDCLCMEYLKNTHPHTICDGITDCQDLSDERNCVTCKKNEFYCRRSGMCVSKGKRCNGVSDCPLKEDEQNCFALTDGKSIRFGADYNPHLKNTGLLSFDNSGSWHVFCIDSENNTEASLAENVCFSLGFSSYRSFHRAPAFNNTLKILQDHSNVLEGGFVTTEKCTGLFIKCSESIDIKPPETNGSLHEIPWNAEIFVNGEYRCMGSIIENDWIVTSSSYFADFNQYITVFVGKGRSYLGVAGPYEQVIRVKGYIKVSNTNIVLLKLERNVKLSRYTRPLYLNIRDYVINKNEKCIVVGRSKNKTEITYLESSPVCLEGHRCFKERDFKQNPSQEIISWSSCIVCQSKNGWYPAAIFNEPTPVHGFTNTTFPSIQYWRLEILDLIKQNSFKTISKFPPCDGIRCGLGKCLEPNRICDGISDCRDGSDESSNSCSNNQHKFCRKSEMRCKNGNCVPKSAFCNKINDCGDWSDEPDRCSCSSYLSLTHPERICDGIRHCHDRSDESALICNCTDRHFKCGETNYCVPQDLVCDGIRDCPEGEDETQCFALKVASDGSPSEVYTRTSGIWHAGCFPKFLTTLQLEEICSKIGYTSGSAMRIPYGDDSSKNIVERPVSDPFTVIRIHKNNGKGLMIAMRLGDSPFITFKSDPNCYRLFLQCL